MTEVMNKAFTNAIKAAKLVREKRNTMPILSNCRIYTDKGQLHVQTTDLDTWLTERVTTLTESPLNILISPDDALTVLKTVKTGTVTLNQTDAMTLVINGVSIKGQDATDYPIQPNHDATEQRTIGGMPEVFAKVTDAVSADPTRWHLNGVFWDKTNITATDGHRLHSAEHGKGWGPGLILGLKGLRVWSDWMSDNVTVSATGTHLTVCDQDRTLVMRTIEGRYPNYGQFIPSKTAWDAVLNAERLIQHLKDLRPVAERKAPTVTLETDAATGTLHLTVRSETFGTTARALTDCASLPPDLRIGLNLNYLLDALTAHGADAVRLAGNSKTDPVTVKAHGSGLTAVIMPVRI